MLTEVLFTRVSSPAGVTVPTARRSSHSVALIEACDYPLPRTCFLFTWHQTVRIIIWSSRNYRIWFCILFAFICNFGCSDVDLKEGQQSWKTNNNEQTIAKQICKVLRSHNWAKNSHIIIFACPIKIFLASEYLDLLNCKK